MKKALVIPAVVLGGLVALTGCSDDSVAPAGVDSSWSSTTEPAPLPLGSPEFDGASEFDTIAEDAFVSTISDRGIAYSSRTELLATAYRACDVVNVEGSGLFDAVAVFEQDGYGPDAPYMAGAVLVMCAWNDGAASPELTW